MIEIMDTNGYVLNHVPASQCVVWVVVRIRIWVVVRIIKLRVRFTTAREIERRRGLSRVPTSLSLSQCRTDGSACCGHTCRITVSGILHT